MTENGLAIMEVLKEQTKPKETMIKQICNILCDCLKALYGCRPSNFYKNQIAVSLVRSYPTLAANSSDTPQALWFHPHARGTNRHAGRIHYRMEYLARTSVDRASKRHPRIVKSQEAVHESNLETEINLVEAEGELRFIVPNQQTKSHVIDLWNKTFERRQKYRFEENFFSFAKDCLVITAYDGDLIRIDFQKLKPTAKPFMENWNTVEPKVIMNNRELYMELKNDFVRALAIIRMKNPSRGSKRVRDEEASRKNPLRGIIQWINAQDDFPSHGDQKCVPILYARGTLLEESSDCAIVWGNIVFPLQLDIKSSFSVLLESFYVFNVSPAPCDKQFYLFMVGAVMGVGQLSTTGMKFLHAVT
ncbi:uncharacterized protein LOC135700554 [Ochlerotatus camptorhynchus]|uniref:uncharacterized protein LOC135700554 n=1 Tax=Ochlerotatus camptorhynchus TaxID=644619 RepID=UPI0031E10F77